MMHPLRLAQVRTVLCLGAHSDDIEIGCGATVLRLVRECPGLQVHWVVFSGSVLRQAEARASAQAFCEGTKLDLRMHNFRDGHFPSQIDGIKESFEAMKPLAPDLIFTHYGHDAHQDHRVLHELTWNTFRSHLVMEYEVPKYDGDLGNPNCFVPVDRALAFRKCDLLVRSFASQAGKHWFDAETFMGLMRLRAVQSACETRFAEAFYARKLVLQPPDRE